MRRTAGAACQSRRVDAGVFGGLRSAAQYSTQVRATGSAHGRNRGPARKERTLGLIAHREYGDTALWRLIAEANRLDDVRRLVPGTVLVIPNE